MTKLIFLLLATIIPLLLISNVYAEEQEFFTDKGFVKNRIDRPAINEGFDPDGSCLFDVFQPKCIPGADQECPKPQFGKSGKDTCFPKTLINGTWEWECPEGYHTIDDDETGQCYSNDEECPDNYILTTSSDSGDKLDRCDEYKIQCDLNENHPLCNGQERTDGIMICDQPDHPAYKYCNTHYDKEIDLPICVYKEIRDCKTRSDLICKAETTIDPCQDIFHGFTGTDENYKPETNQFIVK